MKTWPVQDAKARFWEMLDACLEQGPQLVTKRGIDVAILVPIEEWRRHHGHAISTLKGSLLTDEGRGELNVPPRGRHSRRPVPRFD